MFFQQNIGGDYWIRLEPVLDKKGKECRTMKKVVRSFYELDLSKGLLAGGLLNVFKALQKHLPELVCRVFTVDDWHPDFVSVQDCFGELYYIEEY